MCIRVVNELLHENVKCMNPNQTPKLPFAQRNHQDQGRQHPGNEKFSPSSVDYQATHTYGLGDARL
jgi:hypothetical protein